MIKSFAEDFRNFLVKQNALALAIGVIIGGAIGKVVSGIVDDVFMPIIGLLLPNGEWRKLSWVLSRHPDGTPANAIAYGDLLGRIVDFTIVAMVIFVVLKLALREAPAAPTKACPRCLEALPVAATRCRACTTEL